MRLSSSKGGATRKAMTRGRFGMAYPVWQHLKLIGKLCQELQMAENAPFLSKLTVPKYIYKSACIDASRFNCERSRCEPRLRPRSSGMKRYGMANQQTKAKQFRSLHVAGNPVFLYN